MAFTNLDLSTAVFPDTSATLVSGVITPTTGTWHYFTLPAVVFDPAKTYQVQVDYAGAISTTQLWGYSQLSPDLTGYDTSDWGTLFIARTISDPLAVGTAQHTFTVGPYIQDWNKDVYHAGEHYLLFEWNTTMTISGVRWQETSGEPLPGPAVAGSDTWQGAGLLYFGEDSVVTPQASLTFSGDEPPIPDSTSWRGAGAERTAWWKLQPVDEPTWIEGTTYPQHLEVFWRSATLGWVEKMSTPKQIWSFKANVGQDYYIRATALASDTTSDLVAGLDRTAAPTLGWQNDFTITDYPAPGGTFATAPMITLGGQASGTKTLPAVLDPAYATSRQELGDTVQGWYQFTADKTGLVMLRTGGHTVSLWDADGLIGARYNSPGPTLVAAVTEGVVYGIRITGTSANLISFETWKIAAVVDGFVPMSSLTPITGTGWTVTIGSDHVDLLVTIGTGGTPEAGLVNFNLAALPVPVGGVFGHMADARFEMDCISGAALVNDALSFHYASPGGSDSFYWTYDQWFQPTSRRVRYISLYTGNGTMNVRESDIVAGTIPTHWGTPGVGFALDRWLFRTAGDSHTVYLDGTGLRAYWFFDDEPLDGEEEVVITGDIVRSSSVFLARA